MTHTATHDALALIIPLALVLVFAVLPCALKSRLAGDAGESDTTTLAGMLGALVIGVAVAWMISRGHGSAVCSMALVPGMIVRTRAGGAPYRFERMTAGGMADLRAVDGVNTLTWAPDDLIMEEAARSSARRVDPIVVDPVCTGVIRANDPAVIATYDRCETLAEFGEWCALVLFGSTPETIEQCTCGAALSPADRAIVSGLHDSCCPMFDGQGVD